MKKFLMALKLFFLLPAVIFLIVVCGYFSLSHSEGIPIMEDVTRGGDLPESVTSISFDMESKIMKGKTAITFHKQGDAQIRIGSLTISSIVYNGRLLEQVTGDAVPAFKTEKNDVLEIEYECDSERNESCIIGEKGIVLVGNWYPATEGLAYFRLEALVPQDFTAVSEAEETEKRSDSKGNRFSFRFPHPLEGIHFIAGRYIVNKEIFRGIELYSYFFSDDAKPAASCLQFAKKHLGLYTDNLGKYPYKRFSVAETPFTAGYSMPTVTAINRDTARSPRAAETFLAHEIPRQWLGNLVYVDTEKGDWTEGLITYFSDRLAKDQDGNGWTHRKQILIDYESYVLPEKEFPLDKFRSVSDFASRATGQGKSAMIFHMLRELVGEQIFFRSVRNLIDRNHFKKISWDDVSRVFEDTSEKNLDWFFRQWLKRKGAPSIKVSNIIVRPEGLRYSVSFDFIQGDERYIFDISATVRTDKGETVKKLRIDSDKKTFEVITDGMPKSLVFDEGYDLFRSLSPEEIPPVIAKLLSNEKGIIISRQEETAGEEGSPYSGVTDFFREKGFETRGPEEVRDEDIEGSNLILFGYDNPLAKRLLSQTAEPSPGFTVTVRKNPFNQRRVIGIINADSWSGTEAAMKEIADYGEYSMVSFRDGRDTERRIDASQRGWSMSLSEPVLGVEISRTMNFADIIGKVSNKKIIYIGEQHDKYEHHLAEFEAIKALYKENRRIAIGMEMFQRPFQKALDDYIEGTTDEKQFLKSSEYFKRWSFDYNLYKDILRLARSEKIPVVALNMKKEIIEKVSKSGVFSLTEDEKKELPGTMDMTDEDYRERLREVFTKHESLRERDFNHFFQAQIVWDETMAQSIDEYIKTNPDRQMVVLAGGGHLVFGSGIPKRVFRRNALDHAIILVDQSVEPQIADFILFPTEVAPTEAPKLMVILKEEEGKVKIVAFPENSVSEKAGLKKDDIILTLDGEKIEGIEDMKIFLFYKKKGDAVIVKVLRRGFLFGQKELRLEVIL